MKTPMIIKSACLALGLLLLAACTSTKVLNEWRTTDGTGARFGHFMVVALSKQDQTRRLVEDEFAWQISNMGSMVTRSYNIVPSLNENTTGQLGSLALALGADGILLIRTVAGAQNTKSGADIPPATFMRLSDFLQHAWEDNYDPPSLTTNAVITVESRLYYAKSGKLAWSLATESKNQFGFKWELNLLAKLVLDKLKDGTQNK